MANYHDLTLQFFFEEAEEHLATLEKGLLQLEQTSVVDPAAIEELFRAAHTLKGSAGLVKLKTIARIAHRLEDALEGLRDGQATLSRGGLDALLLALDRIRELTRLAGQGAPEPEGLLAEVEARFDAAASTAAEAAEPPPAASNEPAAYSGLERRAAEPAPDPVGGERRQAQRVPAEAAPTAGVIKLGSDKLEALMNLLGGATVTKTHLVNQLGTMRQMRDEIRFAGDRLLREVNNFSERYTYALPNQVKNSDSMISEFQELEFDRYDELNLFSRKLQEITSDIGEAMRAMGGFFAEFAEEVESLDEMIVEMKERVSEARTVQSGLLFQRFTRTIRELSREAGKEVQLMVSGGETLVDRVIFDGLYDPLLHIVRNAVAHGIEPAQQRRAAGKPEVGSLWMTAQRKGNTVEIQVRDDGRGIQFDKVRQRAVEKGFLREDETISDRELTQMIFRPGFSTSETADSTSGRGVGMNVVMDRLAALSGTIEIHSEAGQGTTFRLIFPLSLVIINVIQFLIGSQRFVIPTNLVAEILDLPPAAAAPTSLEHRDETIPVVDLKAVFGLAAGTGSGRFAIVSQASGNPVALLVDAILSQEDTVIKPFGEFLRALPHLAGSSIAGDGSLRLVLNPARLLAAADEVVQTPLPTAQPRPEAAAPCILVVDDSLSVRKYASLLLKANGLQVLTANNGFEALEVLETKTVDFIITDLEMPLMHGYELLAELLRRGVLKTTPAAVLSSRAGQQHRQKALDLGACDYLIKPFEEETLMAMLRSHLVQAA